MSSKTEILPIHGWGFDETFWDALGNEIGNEYSILKWRRGYFSDALHNDFSGNADLNVLIAHSFGAHLLSHSWIDKADLLIIISGFITFHPGTPQFRKRSRAVLKNMMEKLNESTDEVLSDFYTNCFAPHNCSLEPPSDFNKEILMKDLNALNHAKLNMEALQKVPNICIIHGTSDRIVPNMKGRELFRQLGEQAKYYEIKKTGHALPVTDAKTCWKFIEPEIDVSAQ